jgi:hypothetical protein
MPRLTFRTAISRKSIVVDIGDDDRRELVRIAVR